MMHPGVYIEYGGGRAICLPQVAASFFHFRRRGLAMKNLGMAALVWALLACSLGLAGEVGFIEDFSLAEDRVVPLEQLIQSTEDYYYYHCLHYQHEGQFGEVDKLLQLWIKRYRYTARVHEIRNRQALLQYGQNPKGTLEHIRQRLNLHFNHQKEDLDRKTNYPSTLDQNAISRETLTKGAFSRHGNTHGFEDSALDWLVQQKLSNDRLRDLLHRLRRPDYADLPKLVVSDLNYKYSRGFGSHAIHALLLLTQLEACVEMKPDLLNNGNFINAYLTKLRPSPDVDWKHDPQEQLAYLDRLWAFVKRLAPSQNSLKAHVLYHRLAFDETQGQYDKDRFMEYLKLPRNVGYVNPNYVGRQEHRNHRANLNANYQSVTLLPRIGNDEPLVRRYFHHFFVKEDLYKPYATYLREEYVKEVFAETKVLNGLGDMETWYSMLTPARYQALRERVDIDFTPTRKTLFRANEEVSLDVHVKNVESLIVKVYKINALNFYRDRGREIGTDIDLDGLVPNQERAHKYEEPPLRRVLRSFDFPTVKGPGVFVIELIGNGKSSRALIRKGRLKYHERITSAGHRFIVLDDADRKVMRASLWLSGHEYRSEKDGTILVPFTNKPGQQKIILSQLDPKNESSPVLTTLETFHHRAEEYALTAGFYVDREALLKREKTQVLVRAQLTVSGEPTSVGLLEEPILVIASVDRQNVRSEKQVPNFELHQDEESTYEFQVPEELTQISFTLKAKVQNLSKNKKIDLAAHATFSLNQIDATEKVEDLHLSHVNGEYLLRILGKTGEPRAARPVYLDLKHRDFREHVHVVLQTDGNGCVSLGALKDIASVKAKGPEETAHTWYPAKDAHSYPQVIHGRVGETISVPYMGSATEPQRREFSLLELRGNSFAKDAFKALDVADGFLHVKELTAGDYDLLVKGLNVHLKLRLAEADPLGSVLLGDARFLEVRNAKPLQVSTIEATDDEVRIQLQNSTKLARVHVVATRFVPDYSCYGNFAQVGVPNPGLLAVLKAESRYLSGRNIGDEYRYIIERKYAKKYAGNMLARPSLLLNPWSIRKTETGEQRAAAGERWRRRPEATRGGPGRPHGARGRGVKGERSFRNLDFLAHPAVVLANLRPDDKGIVTIDRKELQGQQQIHVLAVDPQNTVYREVSLPEVALECQDLRLTAGLAPEKHYTEQKRISVVRAQKEFALEDITTSKFEAYDTLAKVYALYVTLSGNATLQEFQFILNWPKLKPEEKQERYSKYACHELSFFLSKKDPAFFEDVIQPYLRNKKDKTFLDHWLLGADLSPYLKSWAYGQLNIVERVLLAQRIQGERPVMARHVDDLYDLLPPNIEHFNHLFKTAIKGSALETTDEFGLAEAAAKANGKLMSRLRTASAEGGARAADAAPAESAPGPAGEPPPAPPKLEKAKQLGKKAREAKDADEEGLAEGEYDDALELAARKTVRQFYRKLDQTEEWAENNYYHLPIEQQNANLITVNAFWNDYAQHDGKQPFFSRNLAEASRNFAEMMLALSVLELPFEAEEHETKFEGARMSLQTGSPMVVYHKEILEAEEAEYKTPILVSQNFFRRDDRYRHENNERLDKYVTDEFVVHVVYGCQIVLTNPTSSRQKLDVLLQFPLGAMPVLNGFYTRSFHWVLEPYSTRTFDYHFYFPKPGQFPHFPVHVAKYQDLVASCQPMTLNVVPKATRIDKTSWPYVSQNASGDEVLKYLDDENINRLNLDKIAFRMRDREFFAKVIALLEKRHVYHGTLWSYGIFHNAPNVVREYLQYHPHFANQCGLYIESALLTIDPVIRRTYQHLEYKPLVNARAHRLGKRYQIVNNRFYGQYNQLMRVLSYRPKLDDADLMTVTYYLLLQDRVDDALRFFKRIEPGEVATALQYDYLKAYVSFAMEDTKAARAIVEKHKDHPVDRWRNKFRDALSQLDEIEGRGPKVQDEEDRTQAQTKLAATEPNFDFQVEAKKITINYQNVKECRINYYLMDIELLFSRNPFVQQYSGQFSYIQPNDTVTIPLPADYATVALDLPQQFHNQNVMVEILAGGLKKTQPYFSNSLAVQIIENYGQLRVTHQQTAEPMPKVYVKVYTRLRGGRVRFYKDGYTDLRGRFDYTSLNTNLIDQVQKFSVLVLSETDGAVVKEASPPKM